MNHTPIGTKQKIKLIRHGKELSVSVVSEEMPLLCKRKCMKNGDQSLNWGRIALVHGLCKTLPQNLKEIWLSRMRKKLTSKNKGCYFLIDRMVGQYNIEEK